MTDTNVQQKNGIERCGHLLFDLWCSEEAGGHWYFAGCILLHVIVANCSSFSDKNGNLESAPVCSLRAEYDQWLRRVAMGE